MLIEFKNGSKMSYIDDDNGVKRGTMRGRRLSDKEYKQMIDSEIDNTDYRVTEMIKALYGN